MSRHEQASTLKVVLLGDSGVGKTCLRSQYVHHVFSNAYKATIGGDYLTTTVVVEDTSAGAKGAAGAVPGSEAEENVSSTETGESGASTGDTMATSTAKPADGATAQTSATTPAGTAAATGTGTSRTVNLQIWDTAGQERFNSISQAFYRGADLCVLVYDITNYESVLSIRDWFSRFMEHCHVANPAVIIVGNKTDRKSERSVNLNEIKDILTTHSNRLNINDYVADWSKDLIEVSSKRLDLVSSVFLRVAQVGIAGSEGPSVRRIQGFDSIDLSGGATVSPGCAC